LIKKEKAERFTRHWRLQSYRHIFAIALKTEPQGYRHIVNTNVS